MTPRVSICCSVLNQQDLLKGMITNVREQVFQDWELVLVDDGSKDNIQAVVDSFNDPRIKLHIFPANRGVPHGMNYALEHSVGEFVAMLSTDERIEPNKLLFQVGYMDERPDVDALWGLPQNGELGLRPEWEQYTLKAHNRSNKHWIKTLLSLDHIPIGGASMLMKNSVMRRLGFFDTTFKPASDLELFVQFFERDYKGVILPYRWAYCVENPTSISLTTKPEDFQAEMQKIRDLHPLKPPKVMSQVTVAIPVRNMAEYVAATLNSVLAQTWQHFEIMVLDDASTDNTADIVSSFNDPRIKMFKVTENGGANAAQNQMLARCDTPFFAVLAADDIADPMWLESMVSEFSKDPWLEFVGCQTDFIGKDGLPHIGDHGFKNIPKAVEMPAEKWKEVFRQGNLYFGAGLYRTQALKDVGGWDTTVGALGDYEMYLKLLHRNAFKVIEKNLVHTRIHDSNQSILKGREAVKKLRWDYKKIKDRYFQPRMKVIIATPFYEMKGFSPYISSLAQSLTMMQKFGIEFDYWALTGDSYVDRAKNTLMTKFLEDPDATDLLMVDSDMEWDSAAIVKLLTLPDEIVVGSYPTKNGWHKWTSLPEWQEIEGKKHPIGRTLENGEHLLSSGFLAGGFMRIRRSALEKFRDHYSKPRMREDVTALIKELGNGRTDETIKKAIAKLAELGTDAPLTYMDPSADPGDPNREYICFSECLTENNIRFGEDRIFGKRLKALGIQVMIYPNITFGHYGVKGWTGNYLEHLKGNVKVQDPNTERVQ